MAAIRWATYRKADGVFLWSGFSDPPEHDETVVGAIAVGDGPPPNPRLERYDATSETKRRAATAPEVAAYDSAQLDATAKQAALPRAVKAMLFFYLRDKFGRNPTMAERAAARDAFIQAYKDVS